MKVVQCVEVDSIGCSLAGSDVPVDGVIEASDLTNMVWRVDASGWSGSLDTERTGKGENQKAPDDKGSSLNDSTAALEKTTATVYHEIAVTDRETMAFEKVAGTPDNVAEIEL